MLTFHAIRYKNILSSGHMFTDIPLDANPLTIIQGKNGSGKSTMLDALCFGLFGKPYRKINKPALVNNKNRKDLIVEVEFSVSDVRYKVCRGINPTVFKVFRDDILVDQNAASSDYQAYFEKYILKYDYSAFTQLVIIGKAMYVGFLRLDASKRRAFIENMLSLTIFGIMAEVHKKKVSALKDQLLDLNNNIKLTKERISIRSKYIEELEADFRKKRESSVKIIEDEIAYLNNAISDLENEEKDTRGQFVEVDEKHIEKLHAKLSTLFDYRSKFNMRCQRYKQDIEFFVTNDSCPSCDQHIAEELKETKIKLLQEKRDKSLEALKKLTEDINSTETETAEILATSKKNMVLNERCRSLNETISANNRRIKFLETSKVTTSPDRTQIESESEKLSMLNTELEGYLSEKDTALETQDYYDLVTSSLKDTGIKSMVIKKFVPVVNNTINKYLRELGFFVKFMLDENFDETIYSRGFDPMNYYNFSEGEKLRIDLAILLAWRELVKLQGNNTTNLIIFDEILDASMDQTGSENFLRMISGMTSSNVVIISHNDNIWANKTTPKIVFEKHKGYSKIQQSYREENNEKN